MTEPSNGLSPAAANERIQALEGEIGKVIVGQERVIQDVLAGLLAAGHLLVEGVPGLGKTLLVRSLAAAVGGEFSRVQFTPDLMPSDVSGHFVFDSRSGTFKVRKGPVFCNFLLADEINRAPAKTQSALLEVMQEQQVTIEGTTFALEPPFMTLATQNPIEQEGTYPLPEAQLDRFLLKIFIDYPSESEEQALVGRVTRNKVGDQLDASAVRQVLDPADIVGLQRAVAGLEVDDQITAYAVRIVRTARDWHGVEFGAGPRGSISLLRAARAEAVRQGRDFVIPDDVKTMTPAVLRHRLRLTTELEIEGVGPDDVLRDILANVPAPRA
jgi:MoxR-like ATPase